MQLPRNHQLPLPFKWNFFPTPNLPKLLVHQFPIDVPEILAELGMEKDTTEMVKALGDCAF